MKIKVDSLKIFFKNVFDTVSSIRTSTVTKTPLHDSPHLYLRISGSTSISVLPILHCKQELKDPNRKGTYLDDSDPNLTLRFVTEAAHDILVFDFFRIWFEALNFQVKFLHGQRTIFDGKTGRPLEIIKYQRIKAIKKLCQ